MLVEGVGDATGAVDRRLGQSGFVEEHVHEIAQKPSGRTAIVVAGVQVARADEYIVARHEAHFLATIRVRAIGAIRL